MIPWHMMKDLFVTDTHDVYQQHSAGKREILRKQNAGADEKKRVIFNHNTTHIMESRSFMDLMNIQIMRQW